MFSVWQEGRGVYCMYIGEGRGDYPTVGVSGPQAVIGWWWVVSSHLNCHCPPQLNSHHHHLKQFSTIESIWGGSILCIDSCHWQQDNERLNGVKRGFCSLVLCGSIIYGAILSTALKYPILDILYEWPSCCIHGDSNFHSICSPPRECKSAKQKMKIMKLEQRNERAASFWCQGP